MAKGQMASVQQKRTHQCSDHTVHCNSVGLGHRFQCLNATYPALAQPQA